VTTSSPIAVDERIQLREQIGWLRAAAADAALKLREADDNDPAAIEMHAGQVGSLCQVIVEKAGQMPAAGRVYRPRHLAADATPRHRLRVVAS
jgi:hypothetical protein